MSNTAEEHHGGAGAKVGIWTLIIAESSLILTFVVVYLFYTGKSISGPQPMDVLHFPWWGTVYLLSSSFTAHFAVKFLEKDKKGPFMFLWLVTMALGAAFLVYTATEWHHLIYEKHLTLATNLFGTTFYSLVGAHAMHVVVGLILLGIIFCLGLMGRIKIDSAGRVEIISLYWHFVDVVWIVVVLTVYWEPLLALLRH